MEDASFISKSIAYNVILTDFGIKNTGSKYI